MNSLSTAEARDRFSDVINRAAYGKERIVVTRRGKALVAVVPIEDVEWLRELEDRIDLEDARLAMAEVEEKGTISLDELKNELGL
jgi:prevent-host-death family protein